MYRCHVLVLVSWYAGKNVQLPTSTVNPFKNELLCKVLCHNICVAIQSMYELGIEPVFWKKEDTLPVEPTLCAEIQLAHKVPV